MSDFVVTGVEPTTRGKVRDIYDLGDELLLVASDRISAYDVVLPQRIPDKGAILTSLTEFWFEFLPSSIPNHLISMRGSDLPEPFDQQVADWGPRFMLVKKLQMVPIECVVRGYVAGSGWKEYQRQGTICGIPLAPGLEQSAQLPEPIFTPAAKNHIGHDENISFEDACDRVGVELMTKLRELSIEIFEAGRMHAADRGLILADTKFEFGLLDGEVVPVLADEVLTADSSRFWPAESYRTGVSPESFDKQYVRDYLAGTGWQGEGEPPQLPDEIVEGTAGRYRELFQLITGVSWQEWKERER